jgi:hypothetical protein
VPIVENPPLARSLYQSVEPGSTIPFALYQAVAGILAFLYRQRVEEKMRAERAAAQAKNSRNGQPSAAADPFGRRGAPIIDIPASDTARPQGPPLRDEPTDIDDPNDHPNDHPNDTTTQDDGSRA